MKKNLFYLSFVIIVIFFGRFINCALTEVDEEMIKTFLSDKNKKIVLKCKKKEGLNHSSSYYYNNSKGMNSNSIAEEVTMNCHFVKIEIE